MSPVPDDPESDLAAVVSAVSASRKYHTLCPDTLRRVAAQELPKHKSLKAAIKATKRRLHQVYAAFETDVDYGELYQKLQAAREAGNGSDFRAACRDGLAQHSSTRERLPILDAFYAQIWQRTGQPTSVLDLGCGLNPLALAWVGLPENAPYIPLDIDAERVRFLNRYLLLVGRPPLARCQDLLIEPPEEKADVALLLKTAASLERQAEGATVQLIEHLRASFVVVSFAVQSLTGREKGMVAHYREQFASWIADRPWPVEELLLETELVFIVRPAD
ncbi:MAG: 16S rRNA methyltransferase [Anaerolineae bacterium]|jgi:16S rRNA (guanine(1405)-N(7))-methyltransferase